MLVSMNWVRDFVNLDGLNIEELIHRFTLSTAEVEEVINYGEGTQGIVLAKVLSVEKHPNSRKLHLLKVDKGAEIVDCVCGAPNVREGMLAAFAPAGSTVQGHSIGKAELAGYESNGMCCSAAELGLGDDHSGILDLDFDAPLGTAIDELLELYDTVFEVDNKSLTNRPDLWGIYGIAREFAALTGRELLPVPQAKLTDYDDLPKVDITLDSPACYRYSALKVRNITAKTSPLNMAIRLGRCAIRSINLLADLTNYIMLEMGQPMHAFDESGVNSILVKNFDKELEFQTLDGTVRKVDPDTMMICTGSGVPVACAGIMGGYESEIKEDTDSLLLESACFDPVGIRKSSTRLGLRTDASARYEKALDPEMTVPAIARFLQLLQDIDSGVEVISSLSDVQHFAYPQKSILLEKSYIDRYTGIEIDSGRIEKILRSLGFGVILEGDAFTVAVPSWRATKDVTIAADLIEEITRVYGYDNFEISSTKSVLYPVREDVSRNQDTVAKDFLAQVCKLHEVHSYLWCDKEKFAELGLEIEDNVHLLNSVNPNHEVLRNRLTPTLLTFVHENRGYTDDFGIFEIGRVVTGLDSEGKCKERKRLGIVLYSRTASEEELFFRLRDIIIDLLLIMKRRNPAFAKVETTHSWQHPVNNFSASIDVEEVARLGVIHPANALKTDKKAAIVWAEIGMMSLTEIPTAPIAYSEPSKFPGIDVDLSFILNKGDSFAQIAEAITSLNFPLLASHSLVDTFALDDDAKSVTIRLAFSSTEKTLTRSEIQSCLDTLVAKLGGEGIELKQ
ncbi:MAG: phenylalanine--tRNA ligase subunit beta [Oscillospiraceae bacterium]|nr:phenylalanine--tRNA ligase subunit beta [Oscillospiraceae bacterium]